MSKSEPILTAHFDDPESHTLAHYRRRGGYQAIESAIRSMKPEQVTETVKASKLRGLGGAGFSTGMKWSFVPKDNPKPRYLVVNADEGEPGTFKDKWLMLKEPHTLIEGMLIASYAIGSRRAYIYIRGEYVRPLERLQGALKEATEAGLVGAPLFGSDHRLDVTIHVGAGAYICGEETALLTSLEGGKGFPKLKPPFPAIEGAFKCPTIVNNVETLSYVPHILKRGAEWFASLGGERFGGMRLFAVSGDVVRPGVYELPLTVTLRELLYDHAGGIRGANGSTELKAVIPGGSSAPILTAPEIDVAMDFDSLAKAGTMGGSGAVIALSTDVDIVEALYNVTRFYHHESCGQCTPCREGTGWMDKLLARTLAGGAREGDFDNLVRIARNIIGNTICPLGDAAALPVISYVGKFRSEFDAYLQARQGAA